jgi:hypothetical protein
MVKIRKAKRAWYSRLKMTAIEKAEMETIQVEKLINHERGNSSIADQCYKLSQADSLFLQIA